MESNRILTDGNLNEIKVIIETELFLRGINIQIKSIKEYLDLDLGRNRISFETTNFQTTPVLFKELKVDGTSYPIEKKLWMRDLHTLGFVQNVNVGIIILRVGRME